MLDIVKNSEARQYIMSLERRQGDATTPELALLARQTRALEYIASQLGALTSRGELPIELPPELRPDFEIAKRRLLEETI